MSHKQIADSVIPKAVPNTASVMQLNANQQQQFHIARQQHAAQQLQQQQQQQQPFAAPGIDVNLAAQQQIGNNRFNLQAAAPGNEAIVKKNDPFSPNFSPSS